MIYITGDTHLPLDIDKIMNYDFCNHEPLTLKDYVIICGDFGGVWDYNKSRLAIIEKLNQRGFTTLFVDGNHENFDLLNSMPVENWSGGKIHRVKENIMHLMRGQVFRIDNLDFFTMGGANSIDKAWRIPYKTWWSDEMPLQAEYDEALNNLEKTNYSVDYILTHTAPLSIIKTFYEPIDELPLNNFLEMIKNKTIYTKWFFGHMHEDMEIDEKHRALYDDVIRLK